MSNSPDGVALAASSGDQVLDRLRGMPNPFEALVRPQRPDDRFADLHVPGLLRGPRELLSRIIDTYRLTEYRRAADLPDARVVTVRGDRGAGKTHMLESLVHRDDSQRQLLVQPAYYETRVSFEQYILGHVVGALLAADRPFDAVAAQLTRRLLRQALLQMNPTDRLFAIQPPAPWSFLWGGGEAIAERVDELADELESRGSADVIALARKHGLEPALLWRIVEAHLARHEDGRDVLSAVRRELYRAMTRASLLGDGDALGQFQEADYTCAGARPIYRAEAVRRQLHALVEACALVQLPIVVAFDNLEGLLAPHGRLDAVAAGAFLDGLAQAVDGLRGILFLILAETELFRQITATANQFALDRIRLGVPVPATGPIDLIDLQPPTAEELRQLIKERVGRLLRVGPAWSNLPEGFPFSANFLDDLAERRDLGLRNRLLRLRDEYSRRVYGREQKSADVPRQDATILLASAWSEQLSAADRVLQGALVSHLPKLHAGLGQLLRQAMPISIGGWRLTNVEPTTMVGDNATYGFITLVTWASDSAPETTGANSSELQVGIGFLLAKGGGMPRDLKTKFELFQDVRLRADALVVLWPRETADDDLVAALPPATRQVWQTEQRRRRVALRSVHDEDLRTLFAFPGWLDSVMADGDGLDKAALSAFVRERCQSLCQLAAPPVTEKKVAHAN